jgi:hypothetical protein
VPLLAFARGREERGKKEKLEILAIGLLVGHLKNHALALIWHTREGGVRDTALRTR